METQSPESASASTVPYTNQMEMLEGLRRVVDAQLSYNQVYHFDADPGCDPGDLSHYASSQEQLKQAPKDLATARQEHAARLAATQHARVRLPLDELASQLDLDEMDRRLLELALVGSTSINNSYGTLHCRNMTIGLLSRIAGDWKYEASRNYAFRLAPEGRLLATSTLEYVCLPKAFNDWEVSLGVHLLVEALGANACTEYTHRRTRRVNHSRVFEEFQQCARKHWGKRNDCPAAKMMICSDVTLGETDYVLTKGGNPDDIQG